MSKQSLEQCQAFMDQIDEALEDNPALTEEQVADVEGLREKIESLCRAGKEEEAQQCCELAMNIIKSGAPVPE